MSTSNSDENFSIDQSRKNTIAWEHGPYNSWIARYGAPDVAAERLRNRPERGLAPLLEQMPPIRGKRVLNIMGSNGLKAIAMAMLGADVTIIDGSEENARYCREVASAIGVRIKYLVSDILDPPELDAFDIAFAELGIVHYFSELAPFADIIARLLVPGGRYVLRDFHPVSTKLLSYRGSTAKVRKYKVDGNYFDDSLVEVPAPFLKHTETDNSVTTPQSAEDGENSTVFWRRWTLGEIVTAFASSTFRIERLVEEPNQSSDSYDAGIPKTFTLVATKEFERSQTR